MDRHMATRVKTGSDVTKEEMLAAVEEAYENGVCKFVDSEVSTAGEPVKRIITVESIVTL